MWTLAQARNRLSARLSEESVIFWSNAHRDSYINEAQRFVAAVTRGVEDEVVGEVSEATPHLDLPLRVTNAHPAGAYDAMGRILSVVPISTANMVDRQWRSRKASRPQWIIVHLTDRKAYASPIPTTPVEVSLTVSVLPNILVNDGDILFNDKEIMAKYLNATLNIACSFAFLRERYDGDAERFYQLGINELQQLGVQTEDIPPFTQVQGEVRETG